MQEYAKHIAGRMLSVLRGVSSRKKKSLYILKPCGKIGQSLEESPQGGKQVKNLEISRSCYQSWPSASVDNILLDLHNSSASFNNC